MIKTNLKNKFTTAILILLIVGQLSFAFTYVFVPKKADAFLGFGDFDFSFTTADIPRYVERLIVGLLTRVATNYANKYLTKFADKLKDKYRIKDFLYYDQYLSNYYISNLILKNVQDPDLRRALDLFVGATVTGETRGYTGTDPNRALLPQLRAAIDTLYIKYGGMPPGLLNAPPPTWTPGQKFLAANQLYYNDRSQFELQLKNQYLSYMASASTASKLEIAIGNGLKAGRVIGGTCQLPTFVNPITPNRPTTYLNPSDDKDDNLFTRILVRTGFVNKAHAQNPPPPVLPTPQPPAPNPVIPATAAQATDPVGCSALGGTWQAGILDQARSIINNPTAWVNTNLDSAFKQIFKNNYDAKDIYFAIGQALGDYIFKKLDLNDGAGVFQEWGTDSYNPNSLYADEANRIDLDNDGIYDGEDNNGDGDLNDPVDYCNFGEVVPGAVPLNCIQSTSPAASGSEFFTPLCRATDDAIREFERWYQYQEEHIWMLEDNDVDFKNKSDSTLWGDRGSAAHGRLNTLMEEIKSFDNPQWDLPIVIMNRHAYYLDTVINSFYADNDIDLAIFGTGDGGSFTDLRERTLNMLEYLRSFRIAFGRCDVTTPGPAGNLLPDGEVGFPDTPPGGEEGEGCYPDIEDPPLDNFRDIVYSAVRAAVENNQDVSLNSTNAADNPNRDADNTFLFDVIISDLTAQGYRAGRVITCSGGDSDDKLMIGDPDDPYGEMYDIWVAFEERTFYDAGDAQAVQYTEWEACNC